MTEIVKIMKGVFQAPCGFGVLSGSLILYPREGKSQELLGSLQGYML